MKKKYISILIACMTAMAVAFAGCGKTDTNTTASDSPDSDQDIMEFITDVYSISYDPERFVAQEIDETSVLLDYIDESGFADGSNTITLSVCDTDSCEEAAVMTFGDAGAADSLEQTTFGPDKLEASVFKTTITQGEENYACELILIPAGEKIVAIQVVVPDTDQDVATPGAENPITTVLNSFTLR